MFDGEYPDYILIQQAEPVAFARACSNMRCAVQVDMGIPGAGQ